MQGATNLLKESGPPRAERFNCMEIKERAENYMYTRRGVATAGETPVRPTMSPYIKMTTDSLSSELTFDE